MDSYKCIVRLSGELGQEVPKTGVGAAHIIMMQIEHGDDAVHSIEKTDNVLKWPSEKAGGKPITVTPSMMRSFLETEFTEEKVSKVFGSFYGASLPEVLPGFEKTRAIPAKKTVQKSKPSAKVEEDEEDDLEEDIDTDIDTDLDDNGGL